MDLALFILVALDAAAGFMCVRARRYGVGIALCGVVVPVALVVTTLMFGAVEQQRSAGAPPSGDFLAVGFGALGTAGAAVLWALVSGGRALHQRRERERIR